MERRCSCDPAKHVFSAGCVYGDPQPTPPGCARVVVCRVAMSPYKCSSEYHHIAETDMRGVNVLTIIFSTGLTTTFYFYEGYQLILKDPYEHRGKSKISP